MAATNNLSRERTVELPRLFDAQWEIDAHVARYKVVACGRRFGKTKLGIVRSIRRMLVGQPVGWFAPTYKLLLEPWREMVARLGPVTKRVSEQEKRIELITGGHIDFWSLDGPDPGRGYKYAHITVDEAAMVRDLGERWNAAIRPTLTDLGGTADFYSTPKGRDFFYTIFCKGEAGEDGWAAFRMPTSANPHMPPGEIEAARNDLPATIFAQEYLAEFIADEGAVFRNVASCVDPTNTGEPYDPTKAYVIGCDLARVQDFTVLTTLDASGRQVTHDRFNSTSWNMVAERAAMLSHEYGDAPIVLDTTGAGDPVWELFREKGLTVRPYHFTNASKNALIEGLQIRFEQQSISLMDVPVQTGELLMYEYDKTPTGLVRTNAPAGQHDDCVIALALAVYGIGRPGGQKKSRVVSRGFSL